MEQSFLDYAMSVIVSRALPDARDGLKPVHRRILWGMYEQGYRPNRAHVKCAAVVGYVMGNYHPHGDQAIYDALVRLGQDFSLRHPLIDPHGNFGSPSDEPAAMRYTESRLAPLAMRMLAGVDGDKDIEEDTVDFVDNFDGRYEEPDVLPSRFPNLLVSGGQGIAVGMATNIPPHNIGEVIDAAVHLIDNPEATSDELMAFVPGPDFPTGCKILGRAGILDAYRTGRGSIRMRADCEVVENDKSADQIIVTAIPYQTSVDQIAIKAAEMVEKGEIDGIREIRNESAKGKTRLVFELKRDAPGLVILNNLYKYTPLQTNFSANMVALVDGVPRTLNLRDALVAYVAHQIEVITRRSEFRLEQKRARAHIVEGLLKALDLIDQIIALIRNSDDRAAAREGLTGEGFGFSEVQANHILDLQLGRLTRLGRTDLEAEMGELEAAIEELEAILADDTKLRGVIKDEMSSIKDEFGEERRTEIAWDPGDLDIEDLIDDEDLVFTMSAGGYVKTMSSDEFRTQGRGGRGVTGTSLKDEDYVVNMIHTSAHAYLLFFSSMGRVYRLKAHQVPQASRTARGTAIVNLLQLQPDEKIAAIIDTRDYETNRFLMFVTRNGTVKKTRFNEYDSSRQAGLIAINLKDEDELVDVRSTNGDDDIFLASRDGQVIRFDENDVRAMGRSAGGVRGMKFRGNDHVVGAGIMRDEAQLMIVTDRGFGKRTPPDQFATKGRGGLGVRGIKVSEERGQVVNVFMVGDDDDVFLVAASGTIIRMPVADISTQGRDASGVTVMSLSDDDRVAAVAPILSVDVGLEDEAAVENVAPDGSEANANGSNPPDAS
ncbi:MAG: DNA gyrase subunit A [Actinomycetia bacterium]|nr:DNA gyrase subunit A [Actinomycetes bacterium]MCP4084947.1 DNA gyrase subunit A [Actinomycetes bacterium]